MQEYSAIDNSLSSVDTTVFTLSSPVLTMQTGSNTKLGSYKIKISGSLMGYSAYNTFDITVLIYDSCDSVVITKNTLISSRVYDIWSNS
jgi:hypothetical protein